MYYTQFRIAFLCAFAARGVRSSPLHHSQDHEIQKRNLFVIECDNRPVPESTNPKVAEFDNLMDLCTSHPEGLGYYCNTRGVLYTRGGNLFDGQLPPLAITDECIDHCRCRDASPKTPPQRVPTKPWCDLDSNDSEQSTANCDDGASNTLATTETQTYCSSWYGRAHAKDCANAITQIPNSAEENIFTNASSLSDSKAQSQSLPKTFNSGDCFVTVHPSLSSKAGTGSMSWSAFHKAAADISAQCSTGKGQGGTKSIQTSSGDFVVDVAVYGTKSNFKKGFDVFYRCSTADPSNEACVQPLPSGSAAAVAPISSPTSPASQPAFSNTQVCGNTCYSQYDCDIEKNCVCASTVDADWSLSSSWGKFKCMHVLNAFASVVVASTYSKCKGRCLLESDQSLKVEEPFNVTLKNIDSTTILQEPPPPGVNETMQFFSGSGTNSTATGTSNAPPVQSQSDPDKGASYHFSTLSANETDDIVCPCNCTEVSAGCCLTPEAWDFSTTGQGQAPLPATELSPLAMECDRSTGFWGPGTD